MRVCKFGGAALAEAAGFRRVREILEAAPDRQVIVVSAPGRRSDRDDKITDLLYACHSAARDGRPFTHLFDRVASRYREIAEDLGLSSPDDALRQVYTGLAGHSVSWAASRGEWLCAGLLAEYLNLPMADAADLIRFDRLGHPLPEETANLLRMRLPAPCVLPGFYGADAEGEIFTFPRGGSDVTAALTAAACNADLYENWKDVPGVAAADPSLVPDALYVPDMTYRELRTLSLLGAQVMQEEAVAPVRKAGIALNVRSFYTPQHPGTWVRPAFGEEKRTAAIGVTSRTGLTVCRLEQAGSGPALARESLTAGLPLERLAADADALCLTLAEDERLPETLAAHAMIREHPHAAAVSVVGEGLWRMDGAARFTAALSNAGILPLSLHMPPEGLYITALLPEDRRDAAVRALYDAFIRR